MTVLRILIMAAIVLGNGTVNLSVPQTRNRASSQARRRRPRQPALPKPVVEPSERIPSSTVWRAHSPYLTLDEIGSQKGIVFSPDLSAPGNRAFYRALGFAYFEDPDWHVVLEQIKKHNATHRQNRIETLLVLSHGTNGDALKLQNGSQPNAPRSYIAPAALQENLEGSGIHFCLLAACNAGRLFRSGNYTTVSADAGNRLFEPPTLGIINASPDFDRARSSITIARRAESHLEVIDECSLSELSPDTIAELSDSSAGELTATSEIAVPEMLIQLLLKDEELRLILSSPEVEKSSVETTDKIREGLVTRFLELLDDLSRRGAD